MKIENSYTGTEGTITLITGKGDNSNSGYISFSTGQAGCLQANTPFFFTRDGKLYVRIGKETKELVTKDIDT